LAANANELVLSDMPPKLQTKILVVDDTETMRKYHQSLLSAEGYQVELATNGQEALNQLTQVKPDLILLDIDMPIMDGITCCKAIKATGASCGAKIVMVTSRTDYNKIKEAFRAGCDDYVTKPVDQNELLGKIKELLKFAALKRLIES
jgi:PleD family two-component response regulator